MSRRLPALLLVRSVALRYSLMLGQRWGKHQFDEGGAHMVASAGKPTKENPGSGRQR
jgi:hypothetical protein